MTAGGIDRFLESCEGKWLQLEPLDESLVRLSRGILTRKRKQELGALLSELRESAATAEDPALLLERISKVDSSTSRFADGIGKVVDAMLETGMINQQAIEEAKKRHAEAFIESQSAELQAEIEEQINQAKEEYRQTSNELASLNKALLATRTKATMELERDLAAMRKDAEAELKLEREHLDLLRSELDDKQESLKNDLEQATKSFTESSDAVVNRFLTIAPILRKAGMLGLSEQNAANGTSEPPPRVRPPQSFSIPQTIFEGSGNTEEENMTEKSFFDRLTELVKNAGFSYSRDDLARFHLSVKCGGLTIIAGNSGTGKSSLATLYARALAGSEFSPDRPDYLMINVNPSWMDIRDLLGHLNTLEGRYFPAESGLYQHLICAQEEIKRAAGSSAIYPICFDEMNLAQVEHYFNDFMQLLEKSSGHRKIRCFSQEVISPECPFRNWPTLDISPAVRFVGTVNFDETTRRLSDRLLDRANLVSMGAGELPALVAGADSSSITCEGSRVTLSDFQRWVRDAALPTSLATIFTSIRVPLQRLGCPVSARGYRATCRFVASSDKILGAEAALDIQVTQRLLSRVRNLVSKDQFEALDDLELILTKSPCGFDRSLEKISEIRSAETAVDFNL